MLQLNRVLSILLVIIGLSTVAIGQEIEIKGLKLGMTRAEVEAKAGPLPLKNFTVAGVHSKYTSVNLEFHEDKLDYFVFFFDSDDFDSVLEAIKAKYPSFQCEKSTVTNRTGNSFTQVDCKLKDKLGFLHLSRFCNDINTSSLSLMSSRKIKELVTNRKKRKKDL